MVYKCEGVIEKVKVKVAAADPDPSKRTVLAVFEFSITVGGAEVKKYTIDLKKLEVYEGASKVPVDANVVVDDEVLLAMIKKEITMEDATAQGKLKVTGDSDAISKVKVLVKKLVE